jgi:DNA-binding GntR family transcriptional regulator
MKLTENVVLKLRHDIGMGVFKSGERLSEENLSKRYGVSRTPIREALTQLEKENLVKIIPNAGAKVVELSYKDVSDIYDVLIVLEGTASRLACSRITDSEIKKLEEYQFNMGKAAAEENIDLVFEMNLQFHWLITEFTNNPYLTEIRNNYRRLVDRFARFAPLIPDQLRATLEEHPQIIDAFKKRNSALAEFVMREHLENAKKFMLMYLQDLQDERKAV